MFSKVLTLIIAGAMVYSFYSGSFVLSIILLIALLFRLFGRSLRIIDKSIGLLVHDIVPERRCNCSVEVSINIEEVLKHSSVERLHGLLMEQKIVKEKDLEKWREKLLNNYKKKYKNETATEKVKFNIKDGTVWKNGEMVFEDTLYHAVNIPYEHTKDDRKDRSLLAQSITCELELRLFVVNGIIKLELGEFSKDYTPHFFREDGLAIYQTYEHITSFPLMYFSYKHKIPIKFLNFCANATDSWKLFFHKDSRKDAWKDWELLKSEIKAYKYICMISDESIDDRGQWEKMQKVFEEKKNVMLEKEGFIDPFGGREFDYYGPTPSDYSFHYYGKYLSSVFVLNYIALNEARSLNMYTDFYEENP